MMRLWRRILRSDADAGAAGGGQQGGGAGEGGQQGGEGGQQQQESWTAALPEDLRANGTLNRYDSQEAANRAHVEAAADVTRVRQELGRRPPEGSIIVPPAEGATPEQIAAYRQAQGIPENADGYKTLNAKTTQDPSHPERSPITLNDEDFGSFRQLCHEHGISSTQAQALLDFYLGRELRNANSTFERQAAAIRDGNAALAQRFGDQLPQKRAQLEPLFTYMAGGDPAKLAQIRELFQRRAFDAQLGNDPLFVEALINLSDHMGSTERLVGGQGAPGGVPAGAATGGPPAAPAGGYVHDYGHNDGTAAQKAGQPLRPKAAVG